MQTITRANIQEIFEALNSQIRVAGGEPISLVVIGGTALAALGLISRTTRDVDVLGELISSAQPESIREIEKFPDWLTEAAERVRRDFNLPQNWLNSGPTSQVRTGLPEGFQERLIKRRYGSYLQINFCSRLDQIHFKLHASVDRGGYHVEDLAALRPSEEELQIAARWALTQDVSETFKELLKDLLIKTGYENVASEL